LSAGAGTSPSWTDGVVGQSWTANRRRRGQSFRFAVDRFALPEGGRGEEADPVGDFVVLMMMDGVWTRGRCSGSTTTPVSSWALRAVATVRSAPGVELARGGAPSAVAVGPRLVARQEALVAVAQNRVHVDDGAAVDRGSSGFGGGIRPGDGSRPDAAARDHRRRAPGERGVGTTLVTLRDVFVDSDPLIAEAPLAGERPNQASFPLYWLREGNDPENMQVSKGSPRAGGGEPARPAKRRGHSAKSPRRRG